MAETKLNGKTILMVIPHTQFRDEEFFEPKKILETEGAKVVVASTSIRTCYGMNGGSIAAEVAIADAKADDYQGLVICGGSSVPDPMTRTPHEADRRIAAIVPKLRKLGFAMLTPEVGSFTVNVAVTPVAGMADGSLSVTAMQGPA